MKKLIYLILFIPVIGFGQTYPHQIEPDTTHRMIMMTDTSVIDSPAMEFLYFSIDSLVEQIARDTLGLDSSFWKLGSNNFSLLQKLPSAYGSSIFLLNNSGNSTTTGVDNIAIGELALSDNTTGNYNIAIGDGAGDGLNAVSDNILIGREAGTNLTSNNNFALGFRSVRRFTGNDNLGIGPYALGGNVGGSASNNVAIGPYSLFSTTDGYQNVAIGASTLRAGVGTASRANVAIGYAAGYNSIGYQNVFIGYNAGYNETGNQKLYIANTNTTTPLVFGNFATGELTINDDLYVNSLETSDYLYSNSDQILGGNWVDGDWTLTGNIDTLFFGDPSNIDTVIVSAGDPDQTLSFSDPDLTISGSGGNTIDISGVNYWDTNADGIYTLDNVGINTTPHATHPLYVVGTMWLDGPVRDGNGNFSGGTGNIMTANSSGEFLWESPSSIGLSEFNNDLGLTQYWSLVGSDLFSNTGGSARDIIVGEIDMELPLSGTPDQLMGRISSTGILNDINIGSGLSLSSGTLSATATSSPWTDSGSYVQTTGSENVYIPGGEALLVGTTTESIYAVDIASTVELRLLGDLYDKNSSNGAADDILTSDGDQIEWATPEISLTPPVLMCYQSSSQSISSSGGFISVPNTVNDSGFGTSTTQKTVPLTGYYRVSAAGTVTAATGNGFNYAINGGVTVTQSVDTAGSYGFSYSTILYMTSGTTVGLYMDATSSGNTVDEISLDVNYIKS